MKSQVVTLITIVRTDPKTQATRSSDAISHDDYNYSRRTTPCWKLRQQQINDISGFSILSKIFQRGLFAQQYFTYNFNLQFYHQIRLLLSAICSHSRRVITNFLCCSFILLFSIWLIEQCTNLKILIHISSTRHALINSIFNLIFNKFSTRFYLCALMFAIYYMNSYLTLNGYSIKCNGIIK